jgi:anti-anti-sigma factor
MRPPNGFTDVELSTLHRPAHILVRLRGEIDIATAPGLRERLLELLRPGTGLVILDVSGISFCDAAGLEVLVSSHRRAMALGITLRLTSVPPRMTRLMRLHGLDRVLRTRPSPSTR